MKLRALQTTIINGPNGLTWVKGPELNDKDELLAPGEVIDVPDTFDVNPEVFEAVNEVRPGVFERARKQPTPNAKAGATGPAS